MIITLTLNPIVDYTVTLPKFMPGELNRFDSFRRDPSGKGLNVSTMLHNLGITSEAFCFLGGSEGEFIYETLRKRCVKTSAVWISGKTRKGIKILDESAGSLTELNELGPIITASELSTILQLISEELQSGDTLVLSGSIPRGVRLSIYAELVQLARRIGARAVVDADGELMKLAIEERPYLIKPNRFEAEQLLQREIATERDAVYAAAQLTLRSEFVALTLGSHGAVLATEGRLIRVYPPRVSVKSTVGCGDVFLASVIAGLDKGLELEEIARYATAASGAATELDGTNFPSADHVERLLAEVKSINVTPKSEIYSQRRLI